LKHKTVDRWLTKVMSKGTSSEKTKRVHIYALTRFCEFTGKNPDLFIKERKKQIKSDDEETVRAHEELLQKFFNE
jgi:hypothetical protein